MSITNSTIRLSTALTEGIRCIWLANELGANFFLTDEFNSTNYLFINLALEDRNILFTTPHILCTLATQEILPSNMFQLYFYILRQNQRLGCAVCCPTSAAPSL